ncbi:hypothetical protein QTP70_003434 [Hemibagrus guttatus]|uniref:ribonuclease H n=1 Tax=Hemibagrus guttatus TaxID=175788 RepID=A0AAE0QI35_9TELE|nr:hypothetical protein QTP70_003434 [Hemibagrus guttatus]
MELEETERRKLAELLSAYSDVFSTGPTDLGRTNLVQHDIQTRPGPPVKQPPRRMASGKQQSADEQIQQNLNSGLASPSNSSWASPIVMVQKKDQTYRLCMDYRVLNERTIKNAYPLPRIQDTLDTLSTAKWFSTLDLASGYWQVELTPGARQAAAFCSRKGLFEWNVAYLGHIVSERGITTDPQKVQKIQQWLQPTNVNEVRQFVGLASYYRRFVKDFATVAKPLHNLLRKHARFHWTPECQLAFEKLKELLTTAPILGYPMDSGDLILDTDASNFGIGAVLSQLQQGEERVLAYGSRSLTPTEQNYCTTWRELLAVVEFTARFRQYLLGKHFTVQTDHSSLQWLIRMKEPEGQLARWLEKLGEWMESGEERPSWEDVSPCGPATKPIGASGRDST